MRHSLLLAALLCVLNLPVQADVIRCTDAAGKITYTDHSACPGGTRQSRPVEVPPNGAYGANPSAAQDQLDSVQRARQLQRDTVDAANRQAQTPPGASAALIDGRGGPAPTPATDPRESLREGPTLEAGTWYPYDGGYGGYHRRPIVNAPDMRPRMRNCDGNGCTDTLGNHYNNRGKLDSYVGPGGQRCRVVNSTQVCR